MPGSTDHKKPGIPPGSSIHILMTGGGAPGAAGILKCLGKESSFHVLAADANENAVGRYLASDFVRIPRADDPAFASTVLRLCREKNIQVVLPLVTKELPVFAGHLDEFEKAGTRVLVSSAASLEIANNKSRLYEFLQWRGIPVPEFRVVETVDQFRSAIEELGYPGKEVCFKPSVSNGSRGFRILSEQINEPDLLFNYKPSSTYTRAADAIRILSSAPFPELLVSEYLPGPEYSVDCLCDRGEASLLVPRLRRKMINGISVEGEFVQEESIMDYCRQVIKALQLNGNIGIQVKESGAGGFLILEINPRVQGTISAALGAGVNLPALAVKQALGLPILPGETAVKWGVRFSRYWEEVFY
ncbi:MAG: ATP-grasp domain-containing protein [Sphingobacteriales bacterium]|nr:ATP-grasp domain-containing protein [Sphingobacteriales bacterium]